MGVSLCPDRAQVRGSLLPLSPSRQRSPLQAIGSWKVIIIKWKS